jgi:hypothetical protein
MARHGERRQEPEAQIYAENRQRALPGGPTVSTEPQGRAGVSEQLFVVAAPPPSDRAACERRFRSNRASNLRNRGRNGAAIRLPTGQKLLPLRHVQKPPAFRQTELGERRSRHVEPTTIIAGPKTCTISLPCECCLLSPSRSRAIAAATTGLVA